MKRILLSIILVLAWATGTWAASYYGCANAAINADNTFCTTATGSCAGDTPVSAATALAGTHSLFANGCTITIPEALSMTATKLSNKDDGGAMVDGGQFTATTTGWTSTATTILANLEAGGTTGGALKISGTGAINPAITIGSVGSPSTITGGTASGIYGLEITASAGTIVIYAESTGGTNGTAHGISHSNAATITLIGNANSNTATTGGAGFYNAGAGTVNMTGNCTGSDTTPNSGCWAQSTGPIVVTGNIVSGNRSTGAQGAIRWTPTPPSLGVTGHYVTFDGGGTPVSCGKNTDDVTKALSTFFFIDPTDGTSDQGTATAAGGGAWAF